MIEVAFHHKLLIYIQPIFSFLRKVSIKVGFITSNRLRVLVLHDIPPNQELVLKKQLQELQKKWNIVSPETFEKMISGIEPIQDNNLLITFDDGLISNRIVAEKVLNPLGIKAIFFVVTDFIDIKNVDDSDQFIVDHICPNLKKEEIPEHWHNMQWEDLSALIEQGHTIGSHTKKHTRLSNCNNKDELIEELVISAKYIDALNNSKVVPKNNHDLSKLRTICSTGSPLSKDGFRYIYNKIKKDLQLSSISGGTDIISCFALGNPTLPVINGEIQCIGLGMDVAAFNNKGKNLLNQKGELVCKKAFPSMPIYFWNDLNGKKYLENQGYKTISLIDFPGH